jgi:hypothetical protein
MNLTRWGVESNIPHQPSVFNASIPAIPNRRNPPRDLPGQAPVLFPGSIFPTSEAIFEQVTHITSFPQGVSMIQDSPETGRAKIVFTL